MNKPLRRESLKNLTLTALLSALVILLQLFFAAVKIGPVTLNFTLIPIVIAGVFVGPVGGLVVGLVSGITTTIQVFTSGDPFYTMLLVVNPTVTAIICLLKTTLAGWLTGIVYKALGKADTFVSMIVSAAVCPIVNTGLFCAGMLLFFRDGLVDLFGNQNVIYIVFILLAGINFITEFAVNVLICPALGEALYSTKMFKRK